jgi:hypothetical protein
VLYVTLTVSPAVVTLAVANAPAEYNVPLVLFCVLDAPEPVTKKQPPTVPPPPVIVYVIADAADVVTLEGVVPVDDAAPNTAVPRTAEPPTV